MLITILGCGTSVGVPMIGLTGKQFRDPKNQRLRTSCLIEPYGRGNAAILIDTSPDLRQQVLRFFPARKPRLDCLLITHSHADHLHGLDDVRPFNFWQKNPIPLYAEAHVLDDIQTRFPYIFAKIKNYTGGGLPQIKLKKIATRTFQPKVQALRDVKITPLPLEHGNISCLGFRIGDFAYITDTSKIPAPTLAKLKNLELLVLDCLRYKPHGTHLNVEQAIAYAKKIQAKKTVFTHLGNEIEYHSFRKSLPPRMVPAYDGMRLRVRSTL